MAYRLKNLSGYPLDVPTLNGPAILPAYGEITAELSAFEMEVMHHSTIVDISDDPLDHDGDGQKGGSKPAEEGDELTKLRADYLDVMGKRPYHGWTAEQLQEKIDAHLAS